MTSESSHEPGAGGSRDVAATISVDRVSKWFGSVVAVNDVSLGPRKAAVRKARGRGRERALARPTAH